MAPIRNVYCTSSVLLLSDRGTQTSQRNKLFFSVSSLTSVDNWCWVQSSCILRMIMNNWVRWHLTKWRCRDWMTRDLIGCPLKTLQAAAFSVRLWIAFLFLTFILYYVTFLWTWQDVTQTFPLPFLAVRYQSCCVGRIYQIKMCPQFFHSWD